MSDYKLSTLWIEAFAIKGDGLDEKRAYLVAAYEKLRERVAVLVEDIRPDMRGLTVHDITHIDALWEIASTIAGSSYPINAAEAFVLGGAFLLHDAAHCVAAYPDGITGLNATAEWKQVCTRHKLDPLNMAADSPEYKKVIFDVLRLLHPKRARDLLGAKWRGQYLLEDSDLREDFKEVVGAVAESHWFNTSQLEQFNKETLTCPASLAPANWRIDKLKIAILLRTADAAHIDSRRAPTFLRAIMNPNGVSGLHWEFQNNMWQVGLKEDSDELYVSSRPFSLEQRAAWWLAYDTAQMIDKELIDADRLLKEFRSESDRLKATNFKSARSPDLFCVTVPTKGWQPVDTSIKVTNIKKLVQTFGGEKLYGPEPKWALRELLQNSVDAVHALRAIGGLGKEEGEIEVSLETVGDHYWLHITDNGVGMGKFVLSEVLVDFGRSLWKDGALSREWETLVGTDFKSIGQFGIGFFSAFMLGDRIRVISRRYERVEGEPQSWVMEFDDGLESRSLLRSARPDESLLRAGTKVSIFLTSQKLKKLCSLKGYDKNLSEILLYLAPALDINLRYKDQNCSARQLIAANDWKSMPAHDLTERIKFHSIERENLYSELKNDEGDIIGRVGISTHRVLSYGVGVVGGIFAGPLDYLEGLVICGDQNDVARKSAVPIA
ncbi:MAG TPA: ATP-binding protein, partial [Marinagarivorans sp.]|nr:ATP-binding protein [Marinagarivorans sp.]